MKALSKTFVFAAIMGIAAVPAYADPRPPELGIGAIWHSHGSVITAEIYCGGTYGGVYPAGRVVVMEVRQPGKAWILAGERTLPAISSTQRYYFTVGIPLDVTRYTTEVRVRLLGADANILNDGKKQTFIGRNSLAVDAKARAVTRDLNPAKKARIVK